MCLQVICIIISGRQYISTNEDAAFDFFAKTFGSRIYIKLIKAVAVNPQAISDAVIPRKVGRSFCRRNNIIGRQGILRMRQADSDNFSPCGFQNFGSLIPIPRYFGTQPVRSVFVRNSNLQAFNTLSIKAAKSGTSFLDEVESLSSYPAMLLSIKAQSVTSLQIGPA